MWKIVVRKGALERTQADKMSPEGPKRTRRVRSGRARRATRKLGYGWLRFWFCRWVRCARWSASAHMSERGITNGVVAPSNIGALRSAPLILAAFPRLFERDVIRTAWQHWYVAMR